MAKVSHLSKAVAGTFVILTISVIAGLITMIVFYDQQFSQLNVTYPPTLPATTTGPPPVMRLPKNLIPEGYKIFIQPHFYTRIIEVVNVTSPNQTLLFTGNSTVYFHCFQKTSTIFLHSKDLVVSNPIVIDQNTNEKMSVMTMTNHQDESNFLEIGLNKPLKTGGNYSLFLDFVGEVSEYLEGLYLSSYTEGIPEYEGDSNAERFLVSTNLQPTDARKVFPCFDEPEMKAVFNVTIIHRRGTKALGNARESGTFIIDDEWHYTRFAPTPRMSTYLFAFTVSEFTSSHSSSHGRVVIKTFARPEAVTARHTQYAENVTGQILGFYENYFGIEYLQQKLDQIALPDLYPAAMENWGLVTYQEAALLYEEGVSSLLHKEEIVTIISHELAHQWFGNLVTMKWWNDIWLNEGFATYMSYFAVDHVEPSFKIKDTYFVNDLHAAFREDALASSHPLSPPPDDVQTTSQITELFDTITYCKGATVVRMLADFVGERVFHKAIKRYLLAFRYENTEQNNLWEYVQQAVTEDGGFTDIAKVMDTWTNQIGYPVITINTTNGEIYQKHFLYNDTTESSLWWYVPIRVMSNTSASTLVTLEDSSPVKKEVFISKRGEWILANVNCTGYYRVNYNPENWERLLTQLEINPHGIPVINRAQLIDDAFNLARAKIVDVTLALNTTHFLHDERAYLPWESAVRNLEYFVLMFDRSEVYGPMQAYLKSQVKDLYKFFSNYTDNCRVPDDHSLQ